jgi:hypothetical protein
LTLYFNRIDDFDGGTSVTRPNQDTKTQTVSGQSAIATNILSTIAATFGRLEESDLATTAAIFLPQAEPSDPSTSKHSDGGTSVSSKVVSVSHHCIKATDRSTGLSLVTSFILLLGIFLVN